MAAAATVGLSAYSILEGRKAAKRADREADRIKAESDAQAGQVAAEQLRQRRLKSQLALTTRSSLLTGARGGANRSSILTSPLGITGDAGGSGRTVLGA